MIDIIGETPCFSYLSPTLNLETSPSSVTVCSLPSFFLRVSFLPSILVISPATPWYLLEMVLIALDGSIHTPVFAAHPSKSSPLKDHKLTAKMTSPRIRASQSSLIKPPPPPDLLCWLSMLSPCCI